jgi:filamentous hemagglutinin family protein
MKSHASMNRIYRLVWNAALNLWVAVAENAKGKSKGGSARSSVAVGDVGSGSAGGFRLNASCRAAAALLGAMLWAASPVQAGPAGGLVSAGSGSIAQTGSATTINQASQRLAIDWNTFSTAAGESVVFAQPNAQAIALNRVLGSNPSELLGSLSANGQVFILNPNGVLFGAGSQVNVGGLVASTLSMSNADFMAGNNVFTKDASASGSVINRGALTAANGGYLALLSPEVRNEGVISATLGTALLAAGNKVTLTLNNGSLLGYSIDQGAINALADNKQLIQANGGQVILSARAADALSTAVVNNTGVIEAKTLQNQSGRIVLLGDMASGQVNVAGKLDASAPNGGDGGFIETSAAHVKVANGTSITTAAALGNTGNWLIDPNDYVIAATGGNITGSALAASLATTNVRIQTTTQGTAGGNGDIIVNDSVTKTGAAATTLTLEAERHITVNNAISSTGGRLNVVMTADVAATNTGNVDFTATGSVVTNNGNFIAGGSAGTSILKKGNNFSMASGSSVNVGTGTLDINVNGMVTLADSSLKAVRNTNYPYSTYNDGTYRYQDAVSVTGGSIATTNTNSAVADIVTNMDVQLSAGSIGSAAAPLKIAGSASASQTLTVNNYVGSSYVNEIGAQLFSNINLSVGSQPNSTHNIQIMGDAGGNGTTGTGHILLSTDATGALILAGGAIDTRGTATAPAVAPTSVSVYSPTIVFASSAVNTGSANFTAQGTTLKADVPDGVADISAGTASLNATNIGTAANPLELGAGNSLNIFNYGGSTYLQGPAGAAGTLSLAGYKTAGTQSIRFADGDHIDYTTDGTRLKVGTISATTGIDTHFSNRSVSLNAYSGAVEFDTNSVNLGSGSLTANVYGTERVSGKAIYATNAKDGAGEITAGNVNLYVGNSTTSGSIKDLEFIKGGTSSNNALQVQTYEGDVDIAELSPNHFKSLQFYLYGSNPVAGQNVAVGLQGNDDINFSDAGSLLTLDATKVNVSGGNRNFTLQATGRNVQIDGNSLSTGNYSVYGSKLTLNGDVQTNGGSISLTGASGVRLNRSVRIDSNADDLANTTSTGGAGYIGVQGAISATANGQTLTVDTSSSTTSANYMQIYSNTDNAGGAYLGGLSLAAKGASASGDNYAYLYGGSYLLNGEFKSAGYTYLTGNATIDTEQGGIGNAGNISISHLLSTNNTARFDTSTTAAGASGGNVDLASTNTAYSVQLAKLDIATTGGAGGLAGNINLPAVSTINGGITGTQTYNGGVVTLNGNLNTNQANVALTGDVRVAATSLFIDTWSSAGTQNGTAGSVTIAGAGVSGTAANKSLTIDTSTNTSSSYFDPVALTAFTQNAGAVSLSAEAASGSALQALTINTSVAGLHNTGTAGAMTVNGATTVGAQTYSGGSLGLGGDLRTNGGNINLASAASIALNTGALTIKTDQAGGSNGAGLLSLGTQKFNGATALTIDTTADGGGAGTDLTLNAIGDTVALSSLNVTARNISMGADIAATGDITVRSTGTANDLTASHLVTSSAGNITLVSGRNFVNTIGANVFTPGAGNNWQVWSTSPAADTRNGLVYDFKQYNAVYGSSTVAGTGNGLFYSVAPTITANVVGSTSKVYDGATNASVTNANLTPTGAIDGDTVSLAGTPSGSYNNANAGTGKTVSISGFSLGTTTNNGKAVYGYTLSSTSASAAIGTITPKSLTVSGMTAVNKAYDGTSSVGLTGGTLNGLVGTETLGFNGQIGTVATKNAGAAKAVTVTGVTLANAGSGTTAGLASNYSVSNPTGLTTDITPKTLTATASAPSKVYDGSTTATATLAINSGLVGTETVTATGSSTFNTKDVATANLVTVNSIVLADGANGGLASNYALAAGETAAATITRKTLTATASAPSKVYDGSTTAAATLTINAGLVGTETVTATGSSTFNTKDVATANLVTVNSIVLADGTNGGLASNYALAAGETAAASITRRALAVTANGINKVYDGNTVAAVTLADNRLTGDVLTLTDAASSFSDKNVGTGKAVSVSSINMTGTDAGNYTFNTTASTTANITPKALTVTANNDSKAFDNKPYSGGNSVTMRGLVSGDTAADVGGSLTYSGTSQGAVGLGSYVITPGGLAGNYAPTFVDGELRIKANSQSIAALGGTTLVDAYESVLQNGSAPAASPRAPQQPEDALRKKDNSRLNIVNCGVLMPKGVTLNTCE